MAIPQRPIFQSDYKQLSIMNENKTIAVVGYVSSVFLSIAWLISTEPALAHHPSNGRLPNSFITGFMSGLGHPIIGIDHLTFVIAIGLLAALSKKLGILIPLAFVTATAIGTGIHLQSVNLPAPELIIAASVLVVGVFLAWESRVSLPLLIVIGAIAGIFHGYAYGESIIGAQATVIGAYLLGFCGIQLGISAIALYIGRAFADAKKFSIWLRLAGLIVGGIGLAFLSNVVLN